LRVRALVGMAVVLGALGTPGELRAQDVVKEALGSFPPETVRVEYSNSAKLRQLPDYKRLRERYLAPQIQKLEKSLAQLGIQEGDVDEVALGWGGGASGLELYGLAVGRFNPKAVSSGATQQGLSLAPLAGVNAYCFQPDAGATCVAVLGDTLGAFGTRSSLGALLNARAGSTASLGSNSRFKTLVDEAPKESPIWGVAVGAGVPDWFKGSMPGQENLELDWSQAFSKVEALSYDVDPADKVRLAIRLECATPAAAASLRQVLDGLKSFQQMAWQNQHPNQPNPFGAVEVDSTGQRVNLRLTTAYSTLGG
jgi:hypothetical protein